MDDVCLLRDSNTVRGEWKLARLTTVYSDSKGTVRNVEVAVVPSVSSSRSYYHVEKSLLKRHVCNLIVLVPEEFS